MTTDAPETTEPTDTAVEAEAQTGEAGPQQIHRSQLPHKVRAVIAEQNSDKLEQQAGFLTQRNFELAMEVEDMREQLAQATEALQSAQASLREAAEIIAAQQAELADADEAAGDPADDPADDAGEATEGPGVEDPANEG